MNPWEVLGWVLLVFACLVALASLGLFGLLLTAVIAGMRENKKQAAELRSRSEAAQHADHGTVDRGASRQGASGIA